MDFHSAVYQIYDGSRTRSISDVLSDSFDINLLKGNGIRVYWTNSNSTSSNQINNIEDVVREKGDYFTRIECIKKDVNK